MSTLNVGRTPVAIAVSGAAGQISYSLLFRLIRGDLLGPDQPIDLRLLETPEALPHLEGVAMELVDCASPLLAGLSCHADPEAAFDGAKLVFLVGATPRGPGMERRDLLEMNADIFSHQGAALNAVADAGVKVLVVGNPVNTNTLIALSNAPRLDSCQFAAMSRLDHNRAVSMLAARAGVGVEAVSRVTVWGNHSTSQYPDLRHARVGDRPALDVVGRDWFESGFIPSVGNRGAEVIRVRGRSSAGSGANAALDHMRDWVFGTPPGSWTSMAILSDGSYGITPGIIFSFPVEVTQGVARIVQGLALDAFSQDRLKASERELLEERALIRSLLPDQKRQ